MKSRDKDFSDEPEVEILPPEKDMQDFHPVARLVALVLDELFTVPGTRFKIGLDPILGLIPGAGDTASSAVGLTILATAAKAGVPKIVLVRMGTNIIINAAGGTIPVAGDIFSAWFKSNLRNYQLLQKHSQSSSRNTASTRSDWIFVGAIFGGVILILLLIILAALTIFASLLKFLFS